MESKIKIIYVDYLKGRNVVYCEGQGPEDPKCLEKHPPEGMEMIPFNRCGAGCANHGTCKAIFANPKTDPDLFELS